MATYKTKVNPYTGQLQLVRDDSEILNFEAGVATSGDLPTSGNAENDARIASDTHHLYVWDGDSWEDQGDIFNIDWSVIENKPSSLVANIDDAVSKRHTQNTDDKIDSGGANETSASEIRDSADKKHTQNSDTKLDEGGDNEVSASEITKKLLSNIIYYVNCDTGDDDTGDGTSDNPFATIQHAIDILPKILESKAVSIRLQPSLNYVESVLIEGFLGGQIAIIGDTEDAGNVRVTSDSENYCFKMESNTTWIAMAYFTSIIDKTNGDCFVFYRSLNGYISGVMMGADANNVNGISSVYNSQVMVRSNCGNASGFDLVTNGLDVYGGGRISYQSGLSLGKTLAYVHSGLVLPELQLNDIDTLYGTYEVLNDSFENWSGGVPVGWTQLNGTLTQEAIVVQDGSYSCKMNGVVAGERQYMKYVISADCEDLRGYTINYDFYARTDTEHGCSIMFRADSGEIESYSPGEEIDKWIHFSGSVTIPLNADGELWLYIASELDGENPTNYIDNMLLTISDAPIIEDAEIKQDMSVVAGKKIGNITHDANGHTTIEGELKIKTYSQAVEPTLSADQRMAIWEDTSVSGSPKVYLVYRRGTGDQVSVELA